MGSTIQFRSFGFPVLLSEYMEIEIHKIVLLPVVLCGLYGSGRIETGCVEGNIWT